MHTQTFIHKWAIFILLVVFTACTRTETTYYSNNKVSAEVTLRNGKKNGRARYYYTNGAIQQESYFKNDVPHGILHRWRADGILVLEENYTEGLKNGAVITWDEKGKKISQMTYRNDTLDGLSAEWYSSGEKRDKGHYKKGIFDGRWLWMSEEGRIVGEGFFENGKGVVKSYYLRGQRAAVTHYTGNEKDGLETAWDDSGRVTLSRTWKMGKIVMSVTQEQPDGGANDNSL